MFFAVSVLLKLILWWSAPPGAAYDDHFAPIFKIAATLSLPEKTDCWQCYQPPLFYAVSAAAGRVAFAAGLRREAGFKKFLQLFPCLYGMLTLWISYRILLLLPVSGPAGAAAFGFLAFCPRLTYLSAMHTNDTFAALAAALTLWAFLRARGRGFSWRSQALLSATVILAVFSKPTALFAPGAVFVGIAAAYFIARSIPRGRALAAAALCCLLPGALLGLSLLANEARYGYPLPDNMRLFHVTFTPRPGHGGVDFLSFRPFSALRSPIVDDSTVSSPPTVAAAHLWYDTEGWFQIAATQGNRPLHDWWIQHYAALTDIRMPWPKGPPPLPPSELLLARALIFLGFFPLILVLAGLLDCAAELFRRIEEFNGTRGEKTAARDKSVGLLTAAAFAGGALVVMAAYTAYYATFLGMRTHYLLPGLPGLTALAAFGWDALSRLLRPAPRPLRLAARILAWLLAFSLYFLAALHIIRLSLLLASA